MPLVGAYVADEYLGRFKTILWSIGIALVGHCVLVVSALPPIITHPHGAITAFSIGLVIMGIGTGGSSKFDHFSIRHPRKRTDHFLSRSNISPLIAEQYRETKMRVTVNAKGERVLMDPTVTISRIFLYFYLMINVGALVGQIGMVYAEKYVGFWLSYLLPTFMFCLCPMVMFACRNKYNQTPPTGSVMAKAWKVWRLAMKGQWSLNPVTT